MFVQVVEEVAQETLTFFDSNQKLSPSIILVTTGSKGVRQCIENAFRVAKANEFRLVIVLYPEIDQQGRLQTGQPETMNNRAILDELAQAAHDQGIREVKTYQQECWGEDELDELVILENSKCMFLAV